MGYPGRPSYMDACATFRVGQWCSFSGDPSYQTLVVIDGSQKPTEQELNEHWLLIIAEWEAIQS